MNVRETGWACLVESRGWKNKAPRISTNPRAPVGVKMIEMMMMEMKKSDEQGGRETTGRPGLKTPQPTVPW